MRPPRQLMNRFGRESGAATVELAAVLPILLMFVFGIVEFGRVTMVCHVLTTTAREGARKACLPGADNSTVLERIANELAQAGLTYDSYELSPADISTADRDEPVTVSVRINYESIAWVSGFFPGLSGMQLQGVAVMRKEGFS
ncbi:MAG: TadE family protein [bacterium]